MYLVGQYTISGNDTLTLNFNTVTIPQDIPIGVYDINWHVNGHLANQSLYENSGARAAQLNVVRGANIIVSQTNIAEDRVSQGETNVNVTYSLQNTGNSDAIISNINHIFRNGALNVSNDWLLSTINNFPDTLFKNQSRDYNLTFNITNNAMPGYDRSEPVVNYYDVRTPQYVLQSDSISVVDSVLVLEPARIRIDSLIAVRDTDTPNAPYVNIDSTFNLSILVSNTGSDTIQTATFRLYRNNVLLPGLVTINNIPPAPDSQRVVIVNQPANQLGTLVYRVSVYQALDMNGQQIAIDQPVDNIEEIYVQQASQLWISSRISRPAGAVDGIVSLNQEFTLEATVHRNGQSPIGSGNLVLRLPNNYEIASFPADSIRNFDLDTMIVEWEISPIGLTPVGLFDSLEIFMTDVPIDLNTLNPVFVSSLENRLPVQVQDAAAISIISDIVAPEGAIDSVMTTGQSFTFRSTINFNSSVAAEGRTAQIILPENYSIENNSPLNLAGTDEVIVNWNVVASSQVDGLDTIYVQVNANDANSGMPIQRTSDPYIVSLVTPALLSLGTAITNPAGATDNIVSTGQEIILRTTVSNLGQAGFDSSGVLQMTASNGVVFKRHRISGILNSPTNAINQFQTGNYIDTLIVPNNQTNAEIIVRLLEANLPADENSGNSVLVRRDSASVALQVVNRANLIVHLEKSSAVNDTLIRSTNQNFSIKAYVNNSGTADIDTSRWLRLDLSNSTLQFNSDQARKFYTINDTVEWNVISPSSESSGIVYVLDDSQPKDENDGLNAFRTPASAIDSIYVDFKAINNINIASTFVINNGDSLVVSTEQDSIRISADILFDPVLDAEKTVTLILPPRSGFASLDSNLTKEITSQTAMNQEWLIRAPGFTVNWRPLVIRAVANSASIPGLPAKIATDTLYIRTEPKASLSLSLQVIEPAGAIDDSLSYGQAFKLQALVKNTQNAAGTIGTGMASIQINEYFSLIDTLGITSDVQKPFTVGTTFFWWIRVNEAAAASMSRVNFLSMINKNLTEPTGSIGCCVIQ